jgi:hypothetical protein
MAQSTHYQPDFMFQNLGPTNPFAAAAALSETEARAKRLEVPDDAEPDTYTYALVKSGPDVEPEEVELQGVAALEVMILWGTNVLHVEHLSPPRDYHVGEALGKHLPTDYLIPQEKIGTTRMPVVVCDGSETRLVLPPGATGTIELPVEGKLTVEQARKQAQPLAALAGGHALPLPAGARARIEIGDLAFQVAAVNAGKKLPAGVGRGSDWAVASYFGLSLLAHAALIGAMAFFAPPMNLLDDEGLDQNRLYVIQQYLTNSAEREQEAREADDVVEKNADGREGATGTRSTGDEGSIGKATVQNTLGRYGIKGPRDNPDPHISRAQALREAAEFGMIGLLNTGSPGDPDAPTAPWGRDTSLGKDERSAQGNMWGPDIHDAFGAGGLGLSGIGEGGGGRGEGIGLGNLGYIGNGAGLGEGQGFGWGSGKLGGEHAIRTPSQGRCPPGASPEQCETTVSGRLPPEVIQRIVRQNYGRFRLCYEQGLQQNPNLEGRVGVRFVIGRDGAVSNASNAGSDLPDSNVVQCVVRAYYGLSFPAPEGGIVTVSYPIMFSPG